MLARPTLAEVLSYRRHVDEAMGGLFRTSSDAAFAPLAARIELGLHHEEQHQELILTDVLAAFFEHPSGPALRSSSTSTRARPRVVSAGADVEFAGGLVEVGFDGAGFCFDNELPRHKVFLRPFALASRLVTVGDLKAFVDDGGYSQPRLWLSAGFAVVQQHGLRHPQRVKVDDGVWRGFGVSGWRDLDDDEPASCLSFYEADAVARFLGGRLPTEAEWEHAAGSVSDDEFYGGVFFDDVATSPLAPQPAARPGLTQLGGDVWEWTASSYSAYPGFVPAAGALGEYNGKFMIGQQVLRGGSAFTPVGHARRSYRNFWPPETRFQLSGLRIARDR
jgi:ergothioneine biosynthesis protein EgtB